MSSESSRVPTLAVVSVASAVAATLCMARTAQAQDAGVLEEVVVTAQFREQAVTDVPISMKVLDGASLQNAGVNDIRDLGRLAPDLFTNNDAESTKVSLRGITTQSNDESQDQSLVVNVDGEYVNRPRVINTPMFDVERVEVLRGPQGTLYGRNATGGAINIISRKPSTEALEGHLSVDAGDYSSLTLDGALNVPLGDKFAVRIAGVSAEHDPYRSHPNLQTDTYDQDVWGARVGLLFQPTDALSIYVAAETSDMDQTSAHSAVANINTPQFSADDGTGECNTAAGWVEIARLNGGVQCAPQFTNNLSTIDRETYNGPNTGDFGFHKVDYDAYRAQVEYAFDAFTIAYRGGFRDATVDADTPLHPSYIFYRNEDIETASHELRFSGGGDRFFWQTGLFYFEEKQDIASGLIVALPGPPGPTGFWPNTFYRPDYKSESQAIFGQVDIPFGDTLTAVLGARYTSDEKSGTFINLPPGPTFDPARPLRPINTPGASINDLSSDHDETTWLVGLNWEPDADTLHYAKISKGYKAGGFDSTGLSYDPETLIAYEVGSKLSRDRIDFSGSAFYYDYTDLQVSVLINTNLGGQVFNAGEATIWGVEGSADAWLTDNDRLSFSATYLNAEYDEFAASIPVQCLNCNPQLTAIGLIDGVPPDLAGNTPPYAPEWILSLGYDHIWTLGNGATITASVFSRYKTSYYQTPYNYRDGKQEDYTQTDASVEFESAGGHWSLRAYVRNIEDELPITYHSYTAAGPDDVQLWYFGAPRTYGVKLGYQF